MKQKIKLVDANGEDVSSNHLQQMNLEAIAGTLFCQKEN